MRGVFGMERESFWYRFFSHFRQDQLQAPGKASQSSSENFGSGGGAGQ